MAVGSITGDTDGDGDDEWDAEVEVVVVSSDGDPVKNAVVIGFWSVGREDVEDTNGNGSAAFDIKVEDTASVTFTVLSVSHSELVYDPSGNAATSISLEEPDYD
jgi:hypothetical protein